MSFSLAQKSVNSVRVDMIFRFIVISRDVTDALEPQGHYYDQLTTAVETGDLVTPFTT